MKFQKKTKIILTLIMAFLILFILRLPVAKTIVRYEIQKYEQSIVFLASLVPLQVLVTQNPNILSGDFISHFPEIKTSILPNVKSIVSDIRPYNAITQEIKDEMLNQIKYIDYHLSLFDEIYEGISYKNGFLGFLSSAVIGADTVVRLDEILGNVEKGNKKIINKVLVYLDGVLGKMLSIQTQHVFFDLILFDSEKVAIRKFAKDIVINLACGNESFNLLYKDGKLYTLIEREFDAKFEKAVVDYLL